ncbi:MAG: hypothetical protein M5U26_07585 [Planctomycetota bacterium]|nr:hypothetical protein [Planctomycetota bacterium]
MRWSFTFFRVAGGVIEAVLVESADLMVAHEVVGEFAGCDPGAVGEEGRVDQFEHGLGVKRGLQADVLAGRFELRLRFPDADPAFLALYLGLDLAHRFGDLLELAAVGGVQPAMQVLDLPKGRVEDAALLFEPQEPFFGAQVVLPEEALEEPPRGGFGRQRNALLGPREAARMRAHDRADADGQARMTHFVAGKRFRFRGHLVAGDGVGKGARAVGQGIRAGQEHVVAIMRVAAIRLVGQAFQEAEVLPMGLQIRVHLRHLVAGTVLLGKPAALVFDHPVGVLVERIGAQRDQPGVGHEAQRHGHEEQPPRRRDAVGPRAARKERRKERQADRDAGGLQEAPAVPTFALVHGSVSPPSGHGRGPTWSGTVR